MGDLALEILAVVAAGRHGELAADGVVAGAILDGREGQLVTSDTRDPSDGDGLGEEVGDEAADGDVAPVLAGGGGDQGVGGGAGGGDWRRRRRPPNWWSPKFWSPRSLEEIPPKKK